MLWFAAAALLLGVAMSAIAETLASRVPRQEEYMARVPAIAIVPWFVAGSLFSIGALPAALSWLAKFLPLIHALAVMRYGPLGHDNGLRDILGQDRHDHDGRPERRGRRALRGSTGGAIGALVARAAIT